MENKMTQVNKAPKFQGTVVSDRMDKTIVVAVETLKTHPKYKKQYVSTQRFKVHDAENTYRVGDKVSVSRVSSDE
jgi:small subunit ribosomal protein S17